MENHNQLKSFIFFKIKDVFLYNLKTILRDQEKKLKKESKDNTKVNIEDLLSIVIILILWILFQKLVFLNVLLSNYSLTLYVCLQPLILSNSTKR